MQFEKIIVVDDDPLIRRMLVGHLQKQELTVLGVANCQQAQEEFQKEPADLLVIDLLLPDGDGLGLMQTLKKISPTADAIIMTGFGTIESAVEAMKQGAANYLLKPFTLPQFDVALQQILEKKKLRGENTYLREQLESEAPEGSFFYQSPEMDRIIRLIKRVASTNATVLIEGESGTGKELVARAIHYESLRRDKSYIKVNCAAVPENLLESEFFGHEKGAFTGASSRREGRFELANGGTLLLDEVTEISLGLQAKLLRVLQEQEFERVGGNRTVKVDVRVLATTNRDLAKAVAVGEFRQDLYFRLNVVPVKLPPLRERSGEVEFLILKMLERFSREHGKPVPKITKTAMAQLASYPWPGNVRELQNYAERAVILSDGQSELEFADFVMHSPGDQKYLHQNVSMLRGNGDLPTLAELEERLIQLALERAEGKRTEAAKMLDMNVRTLRNKLTSYGHDFSDEEDED